MEDLLGSDGQVNAYLYQQKATELFSDEAGSKTPEGWDGDLWGNKHQEALDQLDQLRIVQGAVQKEIGNRERYNGAMAMDDDIADKEQYKEYVSPIDINDPDREKKLRYHRYGVTIGNESQDAYLYINEGWKYRRKEDWMYSNTDPGDDYS